MCIIHSFTFPLYHSLQNRSLNAIHRHRVAMCACELYQCARIHTVVIVTVAVVVVVVRCSFSLLASFRSFSSSAGCLKSGTFIQFVYMCVCVVYRIVIFHVCSFIHRYCFCCNLYCFPWILILFVHFCFAPSHSSPFSSQPRIFSILEVTPFYCLHFYSSFALLIVVLIQWNCGIYVCNQCCCC